MFHALGRLVHRRKGWVLLFAGLLLAAAIVSLGFGGDLAGTSITGLEADAAQARVDLVTRRASADTLVLLFHSSVSAPGEPGFDRPMEQVLSSLERDGRVAKVDRPDEGRINRKGHAAFALITLAPASRNLLGTWRELRTHLPPAPIEVYATGSIPFEADLSRALEHDLLLAELVSLPLALFVLLLVFRSPLAAALPVAVGGLAVACGVGLVLALSRVASVSQYTINICTLVGLGVAIDYSLFTVSRFREELAAGSDVAGAVARAVDRAGRVVAFSALAVVAGLGGLLFFEKSYLRTLGIGGSIVVGFAALFALTVLPALLSLIGRRIDVLSIPWPRRVVRDGGVWHRIAGAVMRRPVIVLIAVLAVLLGLASPAVKMQVAGSDVRVLPEGLEARVGFERMQEAFPGEALGQVLVTVSFPDAKGLNEARIGALHDLSERISVLPGVLEVQSVAFGRGFSKAQWQGLLLHPPPMAAEGIAKAQAAFVRDDVVLLRAVMNAPPESEVARSVVRAIRHQRGVADGVLSVAGPTAKNLDLDRYLAARIPRAVAFVGVATFLVLLLLLGSVVLPVKAVLMNCLSVGAAFGALVFVFQLGHLTHQAPHPLEPAIPVLLFCVLFGLSMDYELLILSRMKEAWEQTPDNTRAVAVGLEKSGGLVTSAAAIMVAVFVAFALARVVLIEAIGVGMAVAVALDATLVRALLVPAAMRLFGRWNWYEPKWLRAVRHALALEHAEAGPPRPPPRGTGTARPRDAVH